MKNFRALGFSFLYKLNVLEFSSVFSESFSCFNNYYSIPIIVFEFYLFGCLFLKNNKQYKTTTTDQKKDSWNPIKPLNLREIFQSGSVFVCRYFTPSVAYNYCVNFLNCMTAVKNVWHWCCSQKVKLIFLSGSDGKISLNKHFKKITLSKHHQQHQPTTQNQASPKRPGFH